MRRINLILATFIGMIGLTVYFVSIPTVNEEGLINLQVEAGDEQVLEDIYFTGNLEGYSGFYLDQDEMKTTGNLSYLESLDAPYNMELFNLQEKYPDLINPLYYDNQVFMYSFLNGENHIISSHLKYYENSYTIDNSQIYLNVLNKETQEIKEETIARTDAPDGDYIEIVGMYEDYPTVKMIYLTSVRDPHTGFGEEVVSLGEYNIETKNYSEEQLLNDEGNFYPYDSVTQLLDNQEQQLFTYYGDNPEDEPMNYTMYLFDYTKSELLPFNTEGKDYTIGDDGVLYGVEFVEGETVLTQYNETADEVTHEVALEQDISQYLEVEHTPLLIEVIDNKLYAVQSPINYDMDALEVQPSDVQVFDIETGERLLNGKIHFDEKNEVNAWSANIVMIGERVDNN